MDSSVVLKFVEAILWPLVALVAVFLFRKPVIRLASEVAVRTRKVSFKGVSIELEALPALAPAWSVSTGTTTEDVRKLTSSMLFDNYTQTLFDQLLHAKDADYAAVDLGGGHEWLTSRLYIFALVLGEVSHLRALVFLETAAGVRRRFLGIATPRDVRVALGHRYPWLEQAFALAYAARYDQVKPDVKGQSTLGARAYVLDVSQRDTIRTLVREFIGNIQRSTEPPPEESASYLSFQPPPGSATSSTIWERAEWIDGERLERDLAGCLEYSRYADSPDLSRRARIDGILRRQGHFVALVDEDRRFAGLIDRCALLNRSLSESDERIDRANA